MYGRSLAMPMARAMLVVVTVLAVGASPPFMHLLVPSGEGASTRSVAVAAGSPLTSNDDNDNNDYRTELEGQVLPVACPAVRGDDPRVEAACAGVAEGTVIPAIIRDSTPPSMFVHNLDGAVWVTFDDPAELDAFQEGDYVRIEGRRVHTFLFRGREGSTGDNDND